MGGNVEAPRATTVSAVMEPTQKEAQNNHIEFGFFGGAEQEPN